MRNPIIRYEEGETFQVGDAGREWRLHPVAAYIDQDEDVEVNGENTEYRWADPQDVRMFDTVPRLTEGLKKALRVRDED